MARELHEVYFLTLSLHDALPILTKISAFWHLFVCSNLVGSTNASELNRDKIKIVYALVTNKLINLGELLVEQIEIAACTSRLDKKLAFPGFITQLCLAK